MIQFVTFRISVYSISPVSEFGHQCNIEENEFIMYSNHQIILIIIQTSVMHLSHFFGFIVIFLGFL